LILIIRDIVIFIHFYSKLFQYHLTQYWIVQESNDREKEKNMSKDVKKKSREEVAQRLGLALMDAMEFLSLDEKTSLIPINDFILKTSPKEDHIQIGWRLCYKSTKMEMSQSYVAKYLNISQSTYSRIETGDKILSMPKAEKLAKLFKCSVAWILTGKD
jgi:DNA-binding XRE family transcriptional regulator